MRNSIREELSDILMLVGAIWLVFLSNLLITGTTGYDLRNLGLVPRTSGGLVGIVASPFLHANLQHLVSNTLPLLVLLSLLAGSQANSRLIVVAIALLGGGLLWLFGRPAIHVGASGVIFGLISFLVVSGLLERRLGPLLISLGVGFFYGGSLLTGIVPQLQPHVSWDGHLCGAIAGVMVAFVLTPRATSPDSALSPARSG